MFGKAKIAGSGARQYSRRPAYFTGKIVNCDASHVFDCRISEISNAGAKIEIQQDAVFPEKFFLLHSRKWTAFEAELIWRKGNLAGLHFRREHDLANETDPQMLPIRFLSVSNNLIGGH